MFVKVAIFFDGERKMNKQQRIKGGLPFEI